MPSRGNVELRQAVLKSYESGLSMTATAKKHGVSTSTVCRWFQLANPEYPYKWAPVAYSGGWVVRGGIKVPRKPMPRTVK